MFSVGLSNSTLQVPFNYSERSNELTAKVRDFEQRMGIKEKTTLSFTDFGKSPAALPSKNIIELPVWFLFHYEDIPSRFRVRDFNDPRLTDRNYLNDLSTWMNHKIGEMGLSSVSRTVEQVSVQKFLELLRD